MQALFLRVAGAAHVVAGAGQPSISNSHDLEEGVHDCTLFLQYYMLFLAKLTFLLFMHN